jgi:hypothetical protein
MPNPTYPGPTGNLEDTQRRSGRAGTVWLHGDMLGEVLSVTWSVAVEQVPVPMPGTYKDGTKPGAESRTGTFELQDVDDRWRRMVWKFLDARRRGDRAAARQLPAIDIVTQIDDIGAPAPTRWSLVRCQLFSYSGGFSQQDQLLSQQIPFTFDEDIPLDTFEYTDSGVVLYENG